MTEDNSKVLAAIATADDPAVLRKFIDNANRKGVREVSDAAFRRLVSILPQAETGTVEHDFWRTIHTFEEALRQERGKTILLSRTRQKVARVGIKQTLIDFATKGSPTDGFKMLIERALPELTGEAVVLRHQDEFDADVVAAARARLEGAGIDTAALLERRAS